MTFDYEGIHELDGIVAALERLGGVPISAKPKTIGFERKPAPSRPGVEGGAGLPLDLAPYWDEE